MLDHARRQYGAAAGLEHADVVVALGQQQVRVVVQRGLRPARRAAHRACLAHAGHTCSGSGGLPENPRPRPSGSALGTNVTPHKAVTVPSV
ncbi:MAG: hypothetical protein ACRDQ4_26075, partial [Pseudonocardiaceae bacterium]